MVVLRDDHFIKYNYMAESKGLGDTIAKITKATGIKKVVDTVAKAAGKDCGCKNRQNSLNKLFPYNPSGVWLSQRYK